MVNRVQSLHFGQNYKNYAYQKQYFVQQAQRCIGKIEEYEKKINLNSDKKRFWLSDLESLNDGRFCDSVPIPADLVSDLIAKESLEWYDDEKYDPKVNYDLENLFFKESSELIIFEKKFCSSVDNTRTLFLIIVVMFFSTKSYASTILCSNSA